MPTPKDGMALSNSKCLWQLRQDLWDHQTVLILASEALAQYPASDLLTQQRLRRIQKASEKSHQLLESLL